MTEKLQVYKCEVCGNIVEMVHEGKGMAETMYIILHDVYPFPDQAQAV